MYRLQMAAEDVAAPKMADVQAFKVWHSVVLSAFFVDRSSTHGS